jgi:hypothetical protein
MAFVTYEYNKERIQMWKIVNADRWRDYQRNYMRDRRAKIKAVSNVPDVPTDEPATD